MFAERRRYDSSVASMTAVATVHQVPGRIRALAKVIHDTDDESFKGLRDVDGHLRREPLKLLLGELGHTLTAAEEQMFNLAYDEYALQLKGVDLSSVAKNRVSETLRLTTAIDSEAGLAGISVAQLLDAVVAAHTFLIKIIAVEVVSGFQDVFDIFMNGTTAILNEILTTVKFRVDNSRREALSPALQMKFTQLNSKLWFTILHLEWFMDAAKMGIFFDAADHLHDLAAYKVWEKYVGRRSPACSAEKFQHALDAFPEWSRPALQKALSYLDDGVVSLYSLDRVLRIWGPFSLLDRNFRNDLSNKLISLDKAPDVVHLEMQSNQELEPGAFTITFSKIHGHLALHFITPAGKLAKLDISRSVGCWTLPGISSDDFETVCDACKASNRILKTALGDDFNVPPRTQSEVNDSFTILHRACFQNNTAYVDRLLKCGGAIVADTAVTDPTITPHFAWTPLLAVMNNPNGDPHKIVRMLLDHNVDVYYRDYATCTATYYAITNNYWRSLDLLIKHAPDITTSSTTIPIFLALGAHLFNVHEGDNRVMYSVVPSPDIIRVLLPTVQDWTVIKDAIRIVESKMDLLAPLLRPSEGYTYQGFDIPEMTLEQRQANDEVVLEHGVICRRPENTFRMKEVLRLLRMHSFYLSCQQILQNPEEFFAIRMPDPTPEPSDGSDSEEEE